MEAERADTRVEPARCLVIGGGLLGSHVARELVRNGHSVSVYSRSFSDWLLAERELRLEVELVRGEIPPGRGLDERVSDAEIVFFLAGSSTPSLSEEDAVGSIMGSLTPALSVMESLRRTNARRIVIASSGGTVYGPVDKLPTSEDAPRARSHCTASTRSRSRGTPLLCARTWHAAPDPALLERVRPWRAR